MAVENASGSEEVRGPLFLIDGNNLAYRAFYALPPEIATSDGLPTNALYGFCLMVLKVLAEYKPGAVIVAWDSREKTFRHEEYEEYKAQRKPMPEPLVEQWPYFEELSAAFGFVNLALPGYEADDILAALARQAEAEGRETIIVTGDRDALQLAGQHVRIMANTKGVTEVRIYDPAAVEERFGVPPRLIPDLIGLKGDSSDNIPGVPGIGDKTAAQLLERFGSLEAVFANLDQVEGAKRRELLRENRELAFLSRRLALLDREVPIAIDAVGLCPPRPDKERLKELFSRLEFTSLFERLEQLPVAEAVAPAGKGAAATRGRTAAVAQLPEVRHWEAVSAEADLVADLGLDRARPVGLASECMAQGRLGGPGRLWLAQPSGPISSLPENPPLRLPTAFYEGLTLAEIEVGERERNALGESLPGLSVICHDLKSQRLLRGLIQQAAHDTYIAGYLLAPGRRDYRLEDLAAELGVPLPGAGHCEGRTAAAVVLPVASEQERRLREQGMWDLFQEVELPLTPVLIAMEEAGVHLDCYRLGEMAGKMQDQLEELEASIYELAGETFNLGSPQQLSRILFEKLGLARQRKTKTGYSTDAKTLEALRGSHPIVGLILNHRELSKLLSTYLLALPQAVDPGTGRLHTTFHQTVTATGRLSSSDPNLQNIPVRTALGAQIRQCFTAEPGNLLVVADYSQIELRIMAHLSGEPALLEAFRRGEDIHARTAAEVFGIAEDQVDSQHRRYAKAVNFGIMYGISAYGLSQSLGIEREEAEAYIARYFERMPRVKTFIEETIAEARARGYATTVFGRRRPIPELKASSFQERSLGERLAVNSVIQGSAADIIKVAMIRCHGRLLREFPRARLVLQVHDELLCEVPAEEAEAVRGAMVEEMVQAYPMDPPLGVDAGVGPDWLSAK